MQKMEIFQKFRQLSDKDRILFQNILGAFAVKGLSLVVRTCWGCGILFCRC